MIAVVTGADGGIGTAFCRELARMGWDLVMVSNRGEELMELAAKIGVCPDVTLPMLPPNAGSIPEGKYGRHTRVWPLVLDLTRADSTDLLMAFLESRSLEADLLINNAGIFDFRDVGELTEKRISLYIDLHVRSVTTLTRSFSLRMAERGGGRILNMSSLSCWTPMPGIALYSATKSYIRVFTRAMHCEMRRHGVTLTACCPGGIATDLFGLPENLKRLALRLGAIERPERFARRALKKTLRGRPLYINGILNRIAIPVVALLPVRVRELTRKLRK